MQRIIVALLVLICGAAAFSTSAAPRRASVLSMADKSKSLPFMPQPPALVGIPAERGFDPLGFTTLIDVKFLSEAEIKHCRIAMLACAHVIWTSLYHLPGEIHNVGLVAAHDVAVKSGSLGQILMWTSLYETVTARAVWQMMEGSGRQPGYFGFDPMLFATTPAKLADMQAKELENGRLAMLAIGGMLTTAVLTGKEFPFL